MSLKAFFSKPFAKLTPGQRLQRCLFWGVLGAVACAGLTFVPHVAACLGMIFVGVKLTIGIKIAIGAAVGFLSGLGLVLFGPAVKLFWSGDATVAQRVWAFFGMLISSVFVMLLVPFFSGLFTAPIGVNFFALSATVSLPVKVAAMLSWFPAFVIANILLMKGSSEIGARCMYRIATSPDAFKVLDKYKGLDKIAEVNAPEFTKTVLMIIPRLKNHFLEMGLSEVSDKAFCKTFQRYLESLRAPEDLTFKVALLIVVYGNLVLNKIKVTGLKQVVINNAKSLEQVVRNQPLRLQLLQLLQPGAQQEIKAICSPSPSASVEPAVGPLEDDTVQGKANDPGGQKGRPFKVDNSKLGQDVDASPAPTKPSSCCLM
jgi:hypothetical protein